MDIYPVVFTGKEQDGSKHAVRRFGEIDFIANYDHVKDLESRGIACMMNGQQLSWVQNLHKNFSDLVDYFKMSGMQHIPDFYCALDLAQRGIDIVHLQLAASDKNGNVGKYAYNPAAGTKIQGACVCSKDTWMHLGCQCGGK